MIERWKKKRKRRDGGWKRDNEVVKGRKAEIIIDERRQTQGKRWRNGGVRWRNVERGTAGFNRRVENGDEGWLIKGKKEKEKNVTYRGNLKND